MNFSYKIKKLKNAPNDNLLFRKWLLDETDLTLTFYNDEIYFSTFMFRGALSLEKMELVKSKDRILFKVEFNKWSKIFLFTIYSAFFAYFIFNVSNAIIFQATGGVLLISFLIYLISYPILKYEVKSALLTELK